MICCIVDTVVWLFFLFRKLDVHYLNLNLAYLRIISLFLLKYSRILRDSVRDLIKTSLVYSPQIVATAPLTNFIVLSVISE